jgi:hypothetical protein
MWMMTGPNEAGELPDAGSVRLFHASTATAETLRVEGVRHGDDGVVWLSNSPKIADLISGAGTEVREIRSIAELEVDADMVERERSHYDGIHVYYYFGPTLPIVVSVRDWPLADADKPDANEAGD